MKIIHSEAEVKRNVIAYLEAKKYLFIPIQNQGTWNPKGFRQTFKGTRGALDLMVFDHNIKIWICIELKSTTGRQTKEQKEFERILKRKAGKYYGKYYIVRSIKDLEDIGL